MDRNTEEIMEAVRKAAKENRLSCSEARKIAAELGVPVREVGQAAEELKVKLFACELGCF